MHDKPIQTRNNSHETSNQTGRSTGLLRAQLLHLLRLTQVETPEFISKNFTSSKDPQVHNIQFCALGVGLRNIATGTKNLQP